MDDFPRMLYRFPGTTTALQDGKYDTVVVEDKEGHKAALSDGYFASSIDARAAGEAALAKLAAKDKAEADAKALAAAKALVKAKG